MGLIGAHKCERYLILARYVTEHKREAGTAWGDFEAASKRRRSSGAGVGRGAASLPPHMRPDAFKLSSSIDETTDLKTRSTFLGEGELMLVPGRDVSPGARLALCGRARATSRLYHGSVLRI